MKLSIVATLYMSAPYIEEFCQRNTKVAQTLAGNDYEIILVNDGSPDESLEIAVTLQKRDKHIVIIDLSRNFGHHKAMMTGLQYACGDKVFLLDSDLEEEPEWLIDFDSKLNENQCDVVFGVQTIRKGSKTDQITGELFYTLFGLITSFQLPRNVITARLMTQRYVNALIAHRDKEVCMAGLWHITGYEQISFPVEKKSNSETTYTLSKKLSVLVNSVTSFSNAPLKAIFYFGLFVSSLAIFYISYLVFVWFFINRPLSGWTSIMASIWLLGGIIISSLGVIGIYLAKIFSETKNRPYTIVRQVYGDLGKFK